MGTVHGGELVTRALEAHGVEEVFALSGGHLDPIFQSCLDHGIRLIDTRHEQAAAHMAEGFARATGRPGVALVTAGPGVTDAVTGVANAYVDAIPMVCIGGRAPMRDEDRLPLQYLDQVGLMSPVTKWARTVLETHRLPEYLAMAFRIASSGRPGPVFLDVPIDVLYTPVDDAGVPGFAPSPEMRAVADPASIEAAAEALANAERPVILAGGGARFSGVQEELREFAQFGRIPVLANSKARGIVSERSDLGYAGFNLAAAPAIHAAAGGPPDVVMLLGARVGMNTGSGARSVIPAGATLIQADVEPEEIGRARDVQIPLVGDARETLRALLATSWRRTFRDHERWIEALSAGREAARSRHAEAMMRSDPPIHQARLAREIAARLTGEDVVVADGGETSGWMGQQAVVESVGRWMSHGYLGCLGVGLPFAMAAKVAHPECRVITVIGDGSVGLNFAEFDTAVRHDLPVVVVVNNDQGWGMVRHGQAAMYGRTAGVELGPTRYDLAAAGFGVHAEYVDRAEEIGPALDRAFASGRPACINVMTDPTLPIQDYGAGRQTAKSEPPASNGDGKREIDLPYYGRRRV